MVTLIVRYYSLGNDRFLRSLEIEGDKTLFVRSALNLCFLDNMNKNKLETDFKICQNILKRDDNKIHVSKTI